MKIQDALNNLIVSCLRVASPELTVAAFFALPRLTLSLLLELETP